MRRRGGVETEEEETWRRGGVEATEEEVIMIIC